MSSSHIQVSKTRGGGALHTFWVRGRAIGKGINFPISGISNGINFYNFGIRNGTDFLDSGVSFLVLLDFIEKFVQGWVYFFRKIGIRNGYFLKPRWHIPDQTLVKCAPWE